MTRKLTSNKGYGRTILHHARMVLVVCLLVMMAGGGWAQSSRYAQLTRDIRSLKRSHYARVIKIGSSVKRNPIYSVFLTAPGGRIPVEKRVRIVLMCGQHGDERTSILSMLPMIHEFSNTINPYHKTLLERAVIVWIPVVNPDGFIRSTRANANGADLNRDWEDLSQPETAAVSRLVRSFKPQVIVDEHEWSANQPALVNCVEVASEGPGSTIRLSSMLADAAAKSMPKGKLAFERISCQSDRDPRLAHRHFASLGICSMLMETSPRSPLQSRLVWYREFVGSLIGSVVFPAPGVISDDLRAAAKSSGRPEISVASLYNSTGPDVSSLMYWFAAALLTLCIVCRCAGIGCTVIGEKQPARLNLRGRRLTVAEMVRLESPTRVKLRMLKENRCRPTDRACRQSLTSQA